MARAAGARPLLSLVHESLGSHAAVQAWRQLDGARGEPARIEVLKSRGKSAVYRLVGVGPGGASVIAKQSRRDGRSPDVVVHLHVHPRLPLRLVECYGFVESQENELSTLFLEDVGSVRYSPLSPGAPVLTAHWLAALHRGVDSAAFDPTELGQLPDRGPDHYRDVLVLSTEAISRWRRPPRGHATVGLRESLLSQLDRIDACWPALVEICASAPRTLVHGDLCAQNMYVAADVDDGPILLPVDWEETGYGPPAVDLAQLLPGHVHFAAGADLTAYATAIRELWPSLDVVAVQWLSTAGTIFRAVAAIRWATQSVSEEWWQDGEVDELRVYSAVIEHALAHLDPPS